MQRASAGAFGAALITFGIFLAPALLAPGRFELANVAGVVLALWIGYEVWRGYGRDNVGATFAYRVRSVAPGLIAASIFIFAIVLLCAWRTPAAEAATEALAGFWRFPFSPVAMFSTPHDGLPTPSAAATTRVAMAYTGALLIGGAFAVLTGLATIKSRDTRHLHGLIWRGVTVPDPAERLAARGAQGLKPIIDPYDKVSDQRVRPRLFVRAASLLFAIVLLSYGPVFLRLLAGSRIPVVERVFEGGLAGNPFFALWITGLWALCIAAALILFVAYLRLAIVLRR